MISIETLRRFDCLAEIGDDNLKKLAAIADDWSVEPGTVIFETGDPADNFFLIQSGEVDILTEISTGDRRVVDTLVAGALLGWSALTRPHVFHFGAIARIPTELVVLDARKLRMQAEQDHELGYRLMRDVASAMGRRLEGARIQLASQEI